jgi:hypothetical protein
MKKPSREVEAGRGTEARPGSEGRPGRGDTAQPGQMAQPGKGVPAAWEEMPAHTGVCYCAGLGWLIPAQPRDNPARL